jgi:hypothetical protein
VLIGYKQFRTVRVPLVSVFLVWAMAACIPYFLFDLNINRANSIYIPLICLAAFGIVGIYQALIHEYNQIVGPSFNQGLEPAISTLPTLSTERPAYVSGFPIVYAYVGVFAPYDPAAFQSSSTVYTTTEKYYHVYRMGSYIFDRDIALHYPQYYYVGHRDDQGICTGVRSEVRYFAGIEQGLCTQEKK